MTNQRKVQSSLSVAVTGSGGAGVMTAGGFLLEAAARSGWFGLMTRSVGPQIRGGEAAALLRFSNRRVDVPAESYNILFVVDWLNFDRFSAEIHLTPDTMVIADPDSGEVPEVVVKSGARMFDMPVKQVLGAIEGGRPNMLATGVVGGIIGLPIDTIYELIQDNLGSKGEKAVNSSKATVEAGYRFAETLTDAPALAEPKKSDKRRWIITGNEAAGLGAVRGGVRFAAAYPITPGTEILEWLAPNLRKLGGALVQAEEEIQTLRQTAEAERRKALAQLAAQQDAEASAIRARIAAAADKDVALTRAEIRRGEAETLKIYRLAEAEAETARIRAENTRSDALMAHETEKMRLERIPAILSEAVKPAEKIKGITINQITGLGRGESTEAASPIDRTVGAILDMAVALPALKKIGDQIGVNLDGVMPEDKPRRD